MSVRFLLVSLAFLLGASCTPKLGEKAPENSLGDLGSTACMSAAADSFKKWVVGKAQARELEGAWDCVDTAFEKFRKYVRGREDENKYKPYELAEFFEKYFIDKDASGQPAYRITPKLQRELMKLKQLFIGGSREYVTRGELASTREVISHLRDFSLKVNDFMAVYTLSWEISNDQNKDSEFFEAANLQLQEFSKQLAEIVKAGHDPYKFTDFIGLLEGASEFYNESWSFLPEIERFLPLAHKIKKLVAGGKEDEIHENEWKKFLLLGARAYMQFNRYYYFIKGVPDSGHGYQLGFIARAFEDGFATFEEFVREKPNSGSRRVGGERGESYGQISREEIDELLAAFTQVWPHFLTSRELVDEMMVVKKLLVGGSTSNWSYQDFATARQKVGPVKSLFERFLPFFRLYTLDWNPVPFTDEQAQVYLKDAQDALQNVTGDFGKLLETSYSLHRLGKILEELERLYPGQVETQSYAETFDKFYPLFLQLKNTLYEDQGDEIARSQWPSFLSFGSRIYSAYLNYYYFVHEKSFLDMTTLYSSRYMIDYVLKTVEAFQQIKPSKTIRAVELVDLTKKIRDLSVIPVEISDSTIDGMVRTFLNSIFNPPDRRLVGVRPGQLDKEVLETIRFELMSWVETEIYLRSLFPLSNPYFEISPYDLQKIIDGKLLDQLDPVLKMGLVEVRKVLSSLVPMVVDGEGRLLISAQLKPMYTFPSISRLNLTRTAGRVLTRAYAGDIKRINEYAGVTQPEAKTAFEELKLPFIDMRILEPDNTAFVDSRFFEANIFVPRSDGNDLASYLELTDILNMILSGLKIDSMLRPSLLAECLPGVTDPPNSQGVNYDCLVKNYLAQMPNVMTSVPAFLSFLEKNERCATERTFFNLVKAAGYIPSDKKTVRLSDVSLVPHVIQYLEMSYSKYDKNNDNYLDQNEAKLAFPTFKGIFKKLAQPYIDKGLLKEADLYPLFTYVLKSAKIPSSIIDFARFLKWKFTSEENRIFKTDRNKLATILGLVAEQISKKSAGVAMSLATYNTHFSAACQLQAEEPDDTDDGPTSGGDLILHPQLPELELSSPWHH